ncbi:MAG: c-type cytochrome biogenesis protein CcmI [Burkholderiales bacterium]|jgi:cytochrome c-type biogenesis protein CcmH|nr:c-type cytochrome biogenesis protein CcmI [Burkholderiales bacterium]
MISFAAYLFAGVAALMVILTLAWIGPRLFSAPGVRTDPDRETTNLEVYRDELAQLDVDYQCGRISPKALEESRIELNRRLLDDTTGVNTPRMRAPARAAGIAVMFLVPLLAGGLYLKIGGIDTLSIVADGEGGTDYRQLLEHLKHNPRDARSWVLLGRYEMEGDRFQEAQKAFESAIGASSKVANDATVLCELAEAIGMAQGGTFAGRPRELVEKALALSPNNAMALELAGGAAYESRDYTGAVMYWKALLSQKSEGSQEYQQLSAAIARIEAEAMATQPEANMALPAAMP